MFRLDEKFELDITFNDVFKVRCTIGLSLDKLGSRAFFLLVLLLKLFGGFSGEEGGGKWRDKARQTGLNQVKIRVPRKRMRYRDWQGKGFGGFDFDVRNSVQEEIAPGHKIGHRSWEMREGSC